MVRIAIYARISYVNTSSVLKNVVVFVTTGLPECTIFSCLIVYFAMNNRLSVWAT